MKVNGQLEIAQAEQLAADPALAPTGRFYANIANPLSALLKYFDGTTWQTLKTTSTTQVISQNSGKNVTVNWATGLHQKVVLTDHCTISFTNPQEGEIHRLFVVQNNTFGSNVADIKRYNLNMPGQATQRQPYQPIGVLSQGVVTTYEWFYSANIQPGKSSIGEGYDAAPTTAVAGMSISPDGKILVSGGTTTPFTSYFGVYDTPAEVQTQLVAKATPTPPAAAAAVKGTVFTPDMRAIFVVSGTTPFIQGWALDRGVASGTAFTNPGTLPTGAGQCIAMHPSGFFVGVGHTTTPFMSIYDLLATGTSYGYGAKATNPVTLPAAQVNALAWCDQGDYIAAASQTTPFIQVWSWVNGIFGTASTNPSTLPAGGPAGQLGHGIAWRPQGDYIAMAMTASPFLYVVPFDRATGAFGTALTINALASAATSVAWTPCGQYLVVTNNASPGLYVFDFSTGTIGTPMTFSPGSSPGAAVNDVVIHPNGETCYVGLNTAVISQYNLPKTNKSYVRYIE